MKDILAGFFSTLAGVGIIMLASCQHSYAATPEQEFVAKVNKAVSPAWAFPSEVYGEVTTTVGVTKCCGVIVVTPSAHKSFDIEAVRATNAVLTDDTPRGIMFDVTYSRRIPPTVLDSVGASW